MLIPPLYHDDNVTTPGQVAWAASIPFDAVKSIVQTQESRVATTEVVKNLIKRQGIRCLTIAFLSLISYLVN